MQDRCRQQWEALGASDPYWAVLSHRKNKGGKWEKEAFFQTGVAEICDVLSRLSALGTKLRFGVALDFGCGVGRLSRALSSHFERVVGIDVSEAMLAEARAVNTQFSNIEFWHNIRDDLAIVQSGSVDFLYSNLVLQHIPRRLQRLFIREFCRVLNSGGVLVFQTPSRPNLATARGWLHLLLGNRIMNAGRRMIHGSSGVMERHALGRIEVLEILRKEAMLIVDVERYDSAGKGFISFRYYATRG